MVAKDPGLINETVPADETPPRGGERGRVATYFAPADRSSAEELARLREDLESRGGFLAALDLMPDWIVALNGNRQAVWANAALRQALGLADVGQEVGLRPGELVGCVHATDRKGGCGTSKACRNCGAVATILKCQSSRATATGECRICTNAPESNDMLNLRLNATYLPMAEGGVSIVVFRDVATERRFDLLERAVFHETLDSVSAIHSLGGLLPDAVGAASETREIAEEIRRIACDVIEELRALQTLLAAENGQLIVRPSEISVQEFLSDARARYEAWDLAHGRPIELETPSDAFARVDVSLLMLVLDDLMRNALEATPPGQSVGLGATVADGCVTFFVKNPGCIPPDVRTQIFQRAFSTKSARGRGAGTYRARLLTFRYLRGALSFTSTERDGTTFAVRIPLDP